MKSHDASGFKERPLVNIFWTGGWDSTFRVASLARKEVIIQPYYLKDNRKSELHELNAINLITKELKSRSSTKGLIREVITMKTSEIEKDKEITKAWHSLSKKIHLGTQYDWLARFAKNKKGIELSIEKNAEDNCALIDLLKNYGKIKINTLDKIVSYYVLDSSESPEELIRLFGNFHFPLLNISKTDMRREAESSGYIDIMNMTWFCHTPVKDKPCGVCVPCKGAIKNGMSYRLNYGALTRNMIKRLNDRIRKLKQNCGFEIPHKHQITDNVANIRKTQKP